MALLTATLVGCTGTPTYEEARRACGLLAGEHHFVDSELVGIDGDELSSGCMRTLGRGVGMDWGSFDERPSTVEVGSPAGWALLGVYFLVASDFGGREEIVPPPGSPDWLWEASTTGPEQAADGDLPLAGLLYDTLTEAVERTVRGDIGAADARISSGGSKLTISSASAGPRQGFEAAGILLHEAAHVRRGAHVSCDGESCDEDEEGAYGLEIFTMWAWMQHLDHTVLRQHDACEDASASIREHCELILDSTNLSICGEDADLEC